jgi:hypothetical protein
MIGTIGEMNGRARAAVMVKCNVTGERRREGERLVEKRRRKGDEVR